MFGLFKKKNIITDNGLNKLYRDNGKLLCQFSKVDGKINGPFESYYLNGTVNLSANFKNGELDGVASEWSFSGNCFRIKENYVNGTCVTQTVYFTASRRGEVATHKDLNDGDVIDPFIGPSIIKMLK